MGRLCQGAHEISGIKGPLFLCGWVAGGFFGWVGWVLVGRVGDGVLSGWQGGWCSTGIIIFEGVPKKLKFSMKLPHLSIDLMKELKYEHQSIFPLWGRVQLNFRDRY